MTQNPEKWIHFSSWSGNNGLWFWVHKIQWLVLKSKWSSLLRNTFVKDKPLCYALIWSEALNISIASHTQCAQMPEHNNAVGLSVRHLTILQLIFIFLSAIMNSVKTYFRDIGNICKRGGLHLRSSSWTIQIWTGKTIYRFNDKSFIFERNVMWLHSSVNSFLLYSGMILQANLTAGGNRSALGERGCFVLLDASHLKGCHLYHPFI